MREYISTLSNSAVFTTSGIFTVPKGVKSIDVFCVGGGGDGCSWFSSDYAYTSGKTTSVVVGSTTISAQGGYGFSFNVRSGSGISGSYMGFNGGSGGGGAGNYWASSYYIGKAGKGGSDGGDGEAGLVNDGRYYFYSYAGKGQGTTTRYFGESDGTLYAGGGGGPLTGVAGSYAETGYYTATGTNTGNGKNTFGANGGGGGGGGYTTTAKNIAVKEDDSVNVSVGVAGIPYTTFTYSTSNSGSGIAIIRWGKK
jgi:hypothetical protein